MMQLVSGLRPAFHLVTGDLAYATPEGLAIPDAVGYDPAQWDKYLRVIGDNGAQSIPWQASVGAHEVEPLDDDGYAGFVTRFSQPYDLSSGSPVVFTFRYGNVAFVHLDGNEMSAQETINNGYTAGAQTAWLTRTLASYRAPGSGVDFIVVVCNCCCYSSNTQHGSDGGLRDVWGPLFDRYQVDLVISGHVHAYERTNPMRAGQPTKKVAPGGTVNPPADGTTYVCVGGGGNGLFRDWYGTTGSGDPGSSTPPKVWRWSGGDSPSGGHGQARGRDRHREGLLRGPPLGLLLRPGGRHGADRRGWPDQHVHQGVDAEPDADRGPQHRQGGNHRQRDADQGVAGLGIARPVCPGSSCPSAPRYPESIKPIIGIEFVGYSAHGCF